MSPPCRRLLNAGTMQATHPCWNVAGAQRAELQQLQAAHAAQEAQLLAARAEAAAVQRLRKQLASQSQASTPLRTMLVDAWVWKHLEVSDCKVDSLTNCQQYKYCGKFCHSQNEADKSNCCTGSRWPAGRAAGSHRGARLHEAAAGSGAV